jgi:hypothetical protein
MSFEEWWSTRLFFYPPSIPKEDVEAVHRLVKSTAERAWNEQQEKIDALDLQVKRLTLELEDKGLR